jgi:hypothetical protein
LVEDLSDKALQNFSYFIKLRIKSIELDGKELEDVL